jgi:hypothetical protein
MRALFVRWRPPGRPASSVTDFRSHPPWASSAVARRTLLPPLLLLAYAGAAAALSVSAPSLVATDETGTVTTDTNSGELCTSACGTGNYLSVDVFGLTLTQNVQDSAYTWCADGHALRPQCPAAGRRQHADRYPSHVEISQHRQSCAQPDDCCRHQNQNECPLDVT